MIDSDLFGCYVVEIEKLERKISLFDSLSQYHAFQQISLYDPREKIIQILKLLKDSCQSCL